MVVVFGSINVDFVMRVERLPAPGETVLGGSYFLVQGGKGANQACAAALAGESKVAMIGCTGHDDWARFAVERLREAGVDLSPVSAVEEPTGCASICVDSDGENAIAVASGANMALRASQIPASLLGPDAVLVLQMETPPEENFAAVRRAHTAGARVVLNVAPAAPVPGDVLDAVDYLVVNEIEARMVASRLNIADDQPQVLAARLSEAHALVCIATLGARGAIAAGHGKTVHVDSPKVTPVDTTGAGDAFVGALAASLDAGAGLDETLARAVVAGALTCERPGAQSSFPARADIERRYALHPAPSP
ncbi:MAG: ribokinase [Gammaproteobacteria bacterium]